MFIPHINARIAHGSVLISSRDNDFEGCDGIFFLLLGGFGIFRGSLSPARGAKKCASDCACENSTHEEAFRLLGGNFHSFVQAEGIVSVLHNSRWTNSYPNTLDEVLNLLCCIVVFQSRRISAEICLAAIDCRPSLRYFHAAIRCRHPFYSTLL